MNENKNIDRLFQEKFKDFEVAPPEAVWIGIKTKLQQKKKRRVIPFWYKLGGIAAAFLIGFLIIDFANGFKNTTPHEQIVFDKSPDNNNPNHSNSDTESNVNGKGEILRNKELQPVIENNYQTGVASENRSGNSVGVNTRVKNSTDAQNNIRRSENGKNQRAKSTVNAVAGTNNSRVSKNKNRNLTDKDVLQLPSENNRNSVARQSETDNSTTNPKTATNSDFGLTEKNIGNTTQIAETTADIKLDSTAIATVVPNALEELLKEKEKKVVTDEPKINRWQVSSNVAPIYLSSSSNSSPIDPTLSKSGKEYKADLTYGVGVRYAVNKKITVRAGVNSIGMNYYTNDLSFIQTTNARSLSNVQPNLQGSLIHIESRKPQIGSQVPDYADTGRKFSSSLNQRTGYIEVPVELSYKLLDKKFGIEIIGGLSTLFLNENSISLISSGIEMEIGKAKNLNETHFSTNLGVGLRYNILKNFDLKVEPTFKYQVNTFSNSGSVNPYFFGLYTGINYRF